MTDQEKSQKQLFIIIIPIIVALISLISAIVVTNLQGKYSENAISQQATIQAKQANEMETRTARQMAANATASLAHTFTTSTGTPSQSTETPTTAVVPSVTPTLTLTLTSTQPAPTATATQLPTTSTNMPTSRLTELPATLNATTLSGYPCATVISRIRSDGAAILVRAAPSENAETLSAPIIRVGETVVILDVQEVEQGAWYQVTHAGENLPGWLPDENVDTVSECSLSGG